MSHKAESNYKLTTNRRDFLKSVSAIGVAVLSSQLLTNNALAATADVRQPPKPENVLSPDAALKRAMEGNQRYMSGKSGNHDFAHEREALSGGQNPYIAVLGCADSRIAPEYAFDSSRGDVFAVRVAGNFANDDGIGSLEFAVAVLETPLIMVLGHEGCGAVEAAISYNQDKTVFPGRIQGIAAAIEPSVRKAVLNPGDPLNNAIKQNVIDNVAQLKTASPILADAIKNGKLKIVGGVYELATGKVNLVA